MKNGELKQTILDLTKRFYEEHHRREPFVPGVTKINYAGRNYDEAELVNLVSSSLDFWLTAGPYAAAFESRVASLFGAERALLVNSGSSANLVMVSALCSPQFEEALRPGDEVITPSVTFPTTLTPILQNQLVPVFVDCEVGTYNVDPALVEPAIGPRTRAILLPHTLGNPCDMDTVLDVARRRDLLVLEDSCDALGATFGGRLVGTFGAMASLSFYPAHQITMGEGGAVVANDSRLAKIALSIRDWGRDCYCEPGKNNTCGNRFSGQHGDLPLGYDHKYVYSNLGYNLKVTDMQAAIGLAQLDKLDRFVEVRRQNFAFYYDALRPLGDRLALPRWEEKAGPSWFGFPLTVREPGQAQRLVEHLENAKIETRKVFAGNILKQPGFRRIPHRVHGELVNTDLIMQSTFFIGVHPGLSEEMREYVAAQVHGFYGGAW